MEGRGIFGGRGPLFPQERGDMSLPTSWGRRSRLLGPRPPPHPLGVTWSCWSTVVIRRAAGSKIKVRSPETRFFKLVAYPTPPRIRGELTPIRVCGGGSGGEDLSDPPRSRRQGLFQPQTETMKVDRREKEKETGNLSEPVIDLNEPEGRVQIPDVPGDGSNLPTHVHRRRARCRPRLDGNGLFRSPSPLSDRADTKDRLHGVSMEQFRAR